MNEIELWESEIEENEKKKEALKEASIYNFYDGEVVQEGVLGTLAAIALLIAANALILAASAYALFKTSSSDKDEFDTSFDIFKNAKSRALIEKALSNIQDFIYKNLPSDIKKYAIKHKIELTSHNKNDKTISSDRIIYFDNDDLIKDFVDGNYSCKEDFLVDEFKDEKQEDETDEEFEERIVSDIASIDTSRDKKYAKYRAFVDKLNKFTKEINDKIKDAPIKHKLNINIKFNDCNYELDFETGIYFSVTFDLPSAKTISSFKEEDLKEIEKIAKIKLQ